MPPSADHLWAAPPASVSPRVESAGLTHLMRGLYFLMNGNPGAAIPYLRLALVYVPDSGYVHERLSRAWRLVGEPERAKQALADGLSHSPTDPWLNWLAGEIAVAERRYGDAAHLLIIATGDDEVARRAGPTLIDALLWDNATEDAQREAERLRALAPTDGDLARELANCFEDHGDLGAARAHYQQARQQQPADRSAALGEMRVLQLAGRTAEAAESLVPLLAYYPEDLGLYVQLARLMERGGRAEAAAYRAEALRLADDDPFELTVVAAGDLLEGRVKEGLALLRRVVEDHAEAVDTRLYLAEVLLQQGDAHGCLKILGGANGAPDAVAYRSRATCLAASGQIDLALEQMVWGILASPRALDPLLDAVRFLSQSEDESAARGHLEDLAARVRDRLEPGDLVVARALLADLCGHGQEALDLSRSLPVSADDPPERILRRADWESRFGDAEGAVRELERLVEEEPLNAVRLNSLGFTLADAGIRLAEANVWLRRAHRLAPDEGFILDSLGWLFFRERRFGEAHALLLRASRNSPGDPEILRHLGEAYRALGKKEAALTALRAALEARPAPALRHLIERRIKELP